MPRKTKCYSRIKFLKNGEGGSSTILSKAWNGRPNLLIYTFRTPWVMVFSSEQLGQTFWASAQDQLFCLSCFFRSHVFYDIKTWVTVIEVFYYRELWAQRKSLSLLQSIQTNVCAWKICHGIFTHPSLLYPLLPLLYILSVFQPSAKGT